MADEMNKEREAFETFVRKRWGGSDRGELTRKESGYATGPVDFAWSAFQAGRASLAASAGSEPVARVNDDGFIVEIGDLLISPGTKLYTHPSPPEGAGWRPIETAPRDGTPIWLYTLAGQCEGYWNYGEWVQDAVYCTYDGAGGPAFECSPTHWMPLPAPPASEAKGA